MAHRAPLLASLCLLSLVSVGYSQSPAEKKTTSAAKPSRAKALKAEEVDPIVAQRQVVAVSLLQSLADDSRSFRDQALRARVGARAADALWDTDSEKARGLFRRAWDEAEAADAEIARREAEELQRQQASGGAFLRRRQRDLRSEVLRLAAKRDRDLGEELLKKLDEASERENKEATDRSRTDPASAPVAAAKRLQLARRLLDDGEIERAIQFATPALDSINRDSINFLSALREKNAVAADQGFVSLLARAERDPVSDANTVSALSSYAFTPFLFINFSPDGGASMSQERRETAAPDLPINVRTTFFRVASEILLRPLAPPDQDTTTSGRVGKYMIIKRLLPLFEQYAPERAPLLKTQMTALAGDVPTNERSAENRAISRGITPDDMSRNPLEVMQERLDRARTSEERDAIYADHAVALAGKGDPKARELVDKIEDAELRKNVRGYIDFQSVQQAAQKNDPTEVARLAKSDELTSMQRIWAYSRAARILMKSDRPRAVELLEEAAAEARRMSGGNPDRARSLIAVATGLIEADRVRAWEIAAEVLKAANSAEGFTGEDSTVSAALRAKQMVMVTNAPAEEFDLVGLFRSLAKDDFNRSIELAKGFSGESPRSVATIAIARSVLEKSKAD